MANFRVIALMSLLLLSSGHARTALSADIRVFGAIGIQTVLEELGPKFEQATGHKLTWTFGTLGGVVKRIQSGESADVVIIPKPGIDTLVKQGQANAESVLLVARSGIGVAARKGATKPDISSVEAFKRTLLSAASISYSDPARGGASGIHFEGVLKQLGIADTMKGKTVFANAPDVVGDLVARGEAEIGVQQFQELAPIAGIELVGPLPKELQQEIVFAATIMGNAKDVPASKALLEFLQGREAVTVLKKNGMDNVQP